MLNGLLCDDLRQLIYRQTTVYGHMGQDDISLSWEDTAYLYPQLFVGVTEGRVGRKCSFQTLLFFHHLWVKLRMILGEQKAAGLYLVIQSLKDSIKKTSRFYRKLLLNRLVFYLCALINTF